MAGNLPWKKCGAVDRLLGGNRQARLKKLLPRISITGAVDSLKLRRLAGTEPASPKRGQSQLAFLRFDQEQRLLIAANLSDDEAYVDLQAIGCAACCGELLFSTVPGSEAHFERQLRPREAAVARLQGSNP